MDCISTANEVLPVEEVEEIVRQHAPKPSLSASRFRDPVRRLTRVGSGGKTYRMFEISTMESRSSDGSNASSSSSSAMTTVTSTTSLCTDPWSSGSGFIEEKGDEADFDWDYEDDNMMLVPKLEPVDDIDIADLLDIKESIVPETSVRAKRPRGRPRKHPKPSSEALAKVAKGRSKTGCITCRRRKKKCDETKPSCKSDCLASLGTTNYDQVSIVRRIPLFAKVIWRRQHGREPLTLNEKPHPKQ